MARFLCWGDGYGPEDDWTCEAGCTREAAERYSEYRDRNGVEYPPEREVFVQGPDGPEKFTVYLHSVPEYEARRAKA